MSVLRNFFGDSFVLLRVSCARCVYLRAYFKPTPMLCDLNRNTTNNSGRRKIPRNQWEPTRDLKQTTWRAGKREWWVLVLYMIGWEGWVRVFKTNQWHDRRLLHVYPHLTLHLTLIRMNLDQIPLVFFPLKPLINLRHFSTFGFRFRSPFFV